MRRKLVPLFAAALAVLVLAVGAAAGPDEARQAGQVRRQLAPQSHAALTNPSNDITRTLVVNHNGSPAAGQAVIQGWNRQTYDDQGLPAGVTAFGQAARLFNVKRIAIQVILRTAGGTRDDTAIGPWRNSGDIGNPRIFQANSPSISAGFGGAAVPQFCESWWQVNYQIRWGNDDFTQGSLLAFADLWNDNCYFIQAP